MMVRARRLQGTQDRTCHQHRFHCRSVPCRSHECPCLVHVVHGVVGREAYAGGSIYCATKYAVRAFSEALLREVVDSPVRVTEIQPGTSKYCENTLPVATLTDLTSLIRYG